MKPLVVICIIVGIILIILGVYYFITPANMLPAFVPGADPNLSDKHYKHGLGSILLGVGSLILAWFQAGKKTSPPQNSN
jgi:O-antigen/teichoic acid export membrane protein